MKIHQANQDLAADRPVSSPALKEGVHVLEPASSGATEADSFAQTSRAAQGMARAGISGLKQPGPLAPSGTPRASVLEQVRCSALSGQFEQMGEKWQLCLDKAAALQKDAELQFTTHCYLADIARTDAASYALCSELKDSLKEFAVMLGENIESTLILEEMLFSHQGDAFGGPFLQAIKRSKQEIAIVQADANNLAERYPSVRDDDMFKRWDDLSSESLKICDETLRTVASMTALRTMAAKYV